MSKQVLKQVSPLTSVWVDEEKETMNDKRQSSVDFLIDEVKKHHPLWRDIFIKAKAMHKEEVQDAYRISPNNELWSNSGIDYYNETFGGNNE